MPATYLLTNNNLGDVEDIEKARDNLGISRDIVDPNNVDIKGGSISVEHFRLNQSEPFEKGYILTADSNGTAKWSVLELSNLNEVTNISSFINNVPYASEEWTSSNFMRNDENLSGITDRVAALSNLGLNYNFGGSEETSEGFLQFLNIEMSNLKVNNHIETKELIINDKLVFNNEFISSNNMLYVDPLTKEFRTFELGNDFEDLTTDIIEESTRRPPSMALLNTVYQNLTQNLATVESTLENIVIDNFYLRITKNLSDIPDPEVARYNLGFGGITISNNSIQTGSLHLDNSFKLVTSSFQDGQFLRCDSTGSGTWQSLPIASTTQNGLVRVTTDYNYDTTNDDTIVPSLKTIKTYNDAFSVSTQNKIDLCLKTANLLSEFRDISINNRSILLSNLHITESDIFDFPKNLGFFQDDVGYLLADNFLGELAGYSNGIEQTRSNLRLEKVAWTGSYFDLLDTPYLDEFSNVFLQVDKNLSELANSEANRTAARENLGLSDMCTMSRSNVDIYGGVITDLTSIKTRELILENEDIPDTINNTCFLKADNDTGKATWTLLPDATPNQKGIITLKNQFEQHDQSSAYTSTFMHEQILSITSEVDSILIDTGAIDSRINSNQDSIEYVNNSLSLAIYHPATGLNYKVNTLSTSLDSLEILVDNRYNEFILNNVRFDNSLSNLSVTTELHIDRVESDLITKIENVNNSIINSDIGQLTQRLDFEVITLNSNIQDEVDIINDRIDSEKIALNTSISTATNTLNTSISNTTATLNTNISTATNTLNANISTATSTLNTSISTATSTLNTSISTATNTLNANISTATNTLNASISVATNELNNRITSESELLDGKIVNVENELSRSEGSLSNLRDDFTQHVIEYQELYLMVDGSGSGSNHLTYKVSKLERSVYGLTDDDPHGIRGELDILIDDFNSFSNNTQVNLQDARDRVLVLETNQGNMDGDISEVKQSINDTNSNVTDNRERIIILEGNQGSMNDDILEIRVLINENDSNITRNFITIKDVTSNLEQHKIHYEYLEEDVNSNINRITELENSLWGITDQNTLGVKGNLLNLQNEFNTHKSYAIGQISNISSSIENTDLRVEQTENDLSSLSNVLENHLIQYEYLEIDVDSNIKRITELEDSLWGNSDTNPLGVRGDLNTYMSQFDQHLLDYGTLKQFSETNINDLNTRLQVVEGGSDTLLETLILKVDNVIPNQIASVSGILETVQTQANNNTVVVNTISTNVFAFSNTLDIVTEDLESFSNSLSNITSRLNKIRDPDNNDGYIKDNTIRIESLENSVGEQTINFNQFTETTNDSINSLNTDLSSLSNIILDPTDGLSLNVTTLQTDLITLNTSNQTTYSIAESLSTVIYDELAGLSVTLSTNISSTLSIHDNDIPSINSEITVLKQNLGIDDGSGGGGGTYLTTTEWNSWKAGAYNTLEQNVAGHGTQINNNENSISTVSQNVDSLDTRLTESISEGLSIIKNVYTIPDQNDTPRLRLSIALGRMYIQKEDTTNGAWQNLHIFR